MKSFEVCMEIE